MHRVHRKVINLDYVLLCRIIIILNMEIVASKEEIVGNPKLLGAAQSNKQQDQFQTPNSSNSNRSPLDPLQFQVRACLNKQPRTPMQDINQRVEV